MQSSVASVELLNSLVYLDRSYIADLYEAITGQSAATLITKNQGKKASAGVPVFSAEISAQETRSYPLSTLAMLSSTLTVLNGEPHITNDDFKDEMKSKIGWIDGALTVFRTTSTTLDRESGQHRVNASGEFFQLSSLGGTTDLALITTPEYFFSGLDAFLKMQETLLKEMSIPVRALVRVFAANTYHKSWVGVPLVVLERE